MRHHCRLVAVAVMVGLVARLVFALGYWRDRPLTHDELEYLALAANLAAGRGFVLDLPGTTPSPLVDRFARPPAYPAFLSVVVRGNHDMRAGRLPTSVPTTVKVAQSLVGAATIAVIALIATRAGGPVVGVVAAWLAALQPSLSGVSAYALTESLFTFLALAAVAVLSLLVDRRAGSPAEPRERRLALAAGALAGAACLTRGSMLFFVPLAALVILRKLRVATALVFLLGAGLVVTPWAARNAAVHGRLILVSAEGGVNFWIGNNPQAVGEGDMAANPQLKAANQGFKARHPGLAAEQLEPHYYREAIAWITDHPLAWTWLLARKVFYSVVPIGPSYRARSLLYRTATVVPYLLLLPFAVAGASRLVSAPHPPWALGMLVLSSLLAGVVFFPQERFRIPAVDPALIVCASAWVGHRLASGWRGRGQLTGETHA